MIIDDFFLFVDARLCWFLLFQARIEKQANTSKQKIRAEGKQASKAYTFAYQVLSLN